MVGRKESLRSLEKTQVVEWRGGIGLTSDEGILRRQRYGGEETETERAIQK